MRLFVRFLSYAILPLIFLWGIQLGYIFPQILDIFNLPPDSAIIAPTPEPPAQWHRRVYWEFLGYTVRQAYLIRFALDWVSVELGQLTPFVDFYDPFKRGLFILPVVYALFVIGLNALALRIPLYLQDLIVPMELIVKLAQLAGVVVYSHWFMVFFPLGGFLSVGVMPVALVAVYYILFLRDQ